MDDQNGPHPEITKQIKEAMMNNDRASAVAMIKEHLEKKSKAPLNIAITGRTGSGKSSFVNAFRGISDRDEGASPTDCVESTMEVKSYPHPRFPNVILWDLPGIGTTSFPADEYLKRVGFQKFDFFIIISDTRFTENDVKLAKEVKKMGKKFYFVRSKIDNDLRAEQIKHRNDFNAQMTLDKIKENCIQGLQREGFQCQVFLMSNFDLHLYDFSLLHETLERELPEHLKHALLMAMPNINQIINKKKEAFQAYIKYYAAASAVGAAVPVPGLSAAVDLALMASVVKMYLDGFCLDFSSLQRISASTSVSHNDLGLVNMQVLAMVDINELIGTLLTQLASTSALMTAEEGSRFIPLFGIPVAMTLSFITTYNALSFFLDRLAEEAHREFIKALQLNTSV